HLAPARPRPERIERRAAAHDRMADDAERERAHQYADPEDDETGTGVRHVAEPEIASCPDHVGTDDEPEKAAPELGVADHSRAGCQSFLMRPIFSSAALSSAASLGMKAA